MNQSRSDAGGHSVPDSEDDDLDQTAEGSGTRMPASEEGDDALIRDIEQEPVSHPGVMPPPD